MDTLTVTLVIRMTGLLLITPAEASGSGPTHVLFPQTHHISEPHVAQIGYRAPECAALSDGICWRDLDGWSLEIGSAGRSEPVHLPYADANLSNRTGLRVPRSVLASGASPALLKSRVILGTGSVTGACARSRWSVRGDDPGAAMADVIEWTIPDVPPEMLVLRVTRLGEPGVVQSIRPPVNGSGTVELYVRHMPKGEADLDDGTATTYAPRRVALGDSATHFHAVYDLLGAGPDQRRLPRYRGEVPGDCRSLWPIGRDWERAVIQRESTRENAGMVRFASTRSATEGAGSTAKVIYTCMIATALPD